MKWVRRLLTDAAVASALLAASLGVAAWRNGSPSRGVHFEVRATDVDVWLTPSRLSVWATEYGRYSIQLTGIKRRSAGVVVSTQPPTPGISGEETLPEVVEFDPHPSVRTWWAGRFGYGVSQRHAEGDCTRNVWVPTWIAVGVTAVPALAMFGTRLLRRRRPAPGRCRRCGYDLRATPARCPECGAAEAVGEPTAANGGR